MLVSGIILLLSLLEALSSQRAGLDRVPVCAPTSLHKRALRQWVIAFPLPTCSRKMLKTQVCPGDLPLPLLQDLCPYSKACSLEVRRPQSSSLSKSPAGCAAGLQGLHASWAIPRAHLAGHGVVWCGLCGWHRSGMPWTTRFVDDLVWGLPLGGCKNSWGLRYFTW